MENIELTKIEATTGNGARTENDPEAAEHSPFILKQGLVSNGNQQTAGHAAEAHRRSTSTTVEYRESTQTQTKTLFRLTVLNKTVYVRLWMVIVFIIILIFVLILVSWALCTVIHEDVDEKYDLASFTVPQYFNGSFQLPNTIFSAELLSSQSNKTQPLSIELQKKLSDFYHHSPALGRYFSMAEIQGFRNGSVVAKYRLSFLMPEQHDQLKLFTLSREVVYNVLRQHLYDQEPEKEGVLYIDPASLEMEVTIESVPKL
ncbi:TPA-induced transmembrane protein homolog [Osmerus mordax]|uniref:TPA-induced transmembrane protein homolog n=1 Tax=Osmerus mordax TaxID=8014 RepID=UPI00350FFDDD